MLVGQSLAFQHSIALVVSLLYHQQLMTSYPMEKVVVTNESRADPRPDIQQLGICTKRPAPAPWSPG